MSRGAVKLPVFAEAQALTAMEMVNAGFTAPRISAARGLRRRHHSPAAELINRSGNVPQRSGR